MAAHVITAPSNIRDTNIFMCNNTRQAMLPIPIHRVMHRARGTRLIRKAWNTREANWSIESVHYIIDWNYDEDRSRIRTDFGPENISRLRRFLIGILKSFQKPAQSLSEMMRILCFSTRRVFDYLRMTKNTTTVSRKTWE